MEIFFSITYITVSFIIILLYKMEIKHLKQIIETLERSKEKQKIFIDERIRNERLKNNPLYKQPEPEDMFPELDQHNG